MSELMEAVQDLEGRLSADQLHLLATLLKELDHVDPVHGPIFRVKYPNNHTPTEIVQMRTEIEQEFGV